VRLALLRAHAWAAEVHAMLTGAGQPIPPTWPRSLKDAFIVASTLSAVRAERDRLTGVIHVEARITWLKLIKYRR
jgi:hypothetical protein